CEVNGVKVVRFHDHYLFDDETVLDVAGGLMALLPADDSPMELVLDFTGVALVSSSLLSKLLQLQYRVQAAHGTLRLCGMSPVVRAIFRRSNLDCRFPIEDKPPDAPGRF